MTTTLLKIKKVSLLFRWLFTVLFLLIPLVNLLAWFYAPSKIDISGNFGFIYSVVPKGVDVLHPLGISTKMVGFLISAIPMIFIEFILYTLIKLFRLYENAEIFTVQNVKFIKQIGFALLITQPLSVICDGLLSLLLSFDNPHGFRYITLNLSDTNISLIITAFLIILISWIMTEGYRLREEQQLTI